MGRESIQYPNENNSGRASDSSLSYNCILLRGLPQDTRIIIHNSEAARAQSTAKPTGSKGRGRGGNQQQSSNEADSVGSITQGHGGQAEHEVPNEEVPNLVDYQKKKSAKK